MSRAVTVFRVDAPLEGDGPADRAAFYFETEKEAQDFAIEDGAEAGILNPWEEAIVSTRRVTPESARELIATTKRTLSRTGGDA